MSRRSPWNTALAAVTSALTLYSLSFAAEKSSYELIQEEFATGQMTLEDRLVLEVQSIKDPQALPAALQSDTPEATKCATEILLEVRHNWNSFDEQNQALLKQLLARPVRTFSFVSPDGNFKVWYNTSGTHAVPTADTSPANGTPDYIDNIANYCDSSYRAEITNLGHLVPPSDGIAGGDSRYDVYTEEMGYYGYCQPEVGGPNPWNDATSYLSVHRNFIGFPPNDDPEGDVKGAAKVTVAHEYYHAVQFAYDVGENVWFMEAASTWMEDQVYDVVNDNYNYCSEWFAVPDLSLHSTSGLHLYAAFIWPVYLVQNYGSSIMPAIWSELITTSPYTAFTTVLATHSATLNPTVADFMAWNFITNSRDDGAHFEEASHYPLVSLTRTHNTYPVSGLGPLGGKAPDAMGSNYVVCNIPSNAQTITIDFNGDNSTPWIVTMLAWKNSPVDSYSEAVMTLNGSGDGSYTLFGASSWNSLVMVITNVSQTLNDRQYTYGASYTTAPNIAVSVDAMAGDSVYSNTSASVSFRIENTGVLNETYNVSADDALGWTLNPSAPSINLDPAEVGEVSVQVICPAATLPGVLDEITLTAEATSIFGVSDVDTSNVEVFVMHGDADNNGTITVSDPVYIINYIFGGGPAPIPVLESGDASCESIVNVSDAVFLITYIFAAGPTPPCNPF